MSGLERKLENLKLGRGKRPKLNNQTVAMRMSGQTKESLKAIASQYGCFHGGSPWIAGLLTKIANGELIVVPAPPQPTERQTNTA